MLKDIVLVIAGFGVGTAFGAKVVGDIKSEVMVGFADLKAFVTAELSKVKL